LLEQTEVFVWVVVDVIKGVSAHQFPCSAHGLYYRFREAKFSKPNCLQKQLVRGWVLACMDRIASEVFIISLFEFFPRSHPCLKKRLLPRRMHL